MAKARILKVVNYRQEDLPTLAALEEVLKREGKEFTQWVRDETASYVKKHGKGNPAFKLETFSDPNALALPIAWEDPDDEKVHSLSQEDRAFMKAQMAKWYKAIQK